MRRIVFSLIAIFSLLFITACSVIMLPIGDSDSDSDIDSDIRNDIPAIISQSSKIKELYYEEIPEASYSGGVKIESISKVWLKDSVLKTEDEISFYKEDELLYTEIVGQLYDYNTLDHRSYYIGPYPEQAHLQISTFQESNGPPRDQTILWYSDRATLDLDTIQEDIHEGEECLIAEILKNNSGSTQVWISKFSGLPVKIVNKYNGNTSVREYHGFKIGEDSVPDANLLISPDAIIL